MAKEIKYAHGKNPNSLANLQKGRTFRNRQFAKEQSQKAAESRKVKRTMRDIAEQMIQEETTFNLPDGTQITMTKLEVILANYIKSCASNPTHKNLLALRSILGEDVQHIETNVNISGKYDNISITKEMIAKAEAIFDAQEENDESNES